MCISFLFAGRMCCVHFCSSGRSRVAVCILSPALKSRLQRAFLFFAGRVGCVHSLFGWRSRVLFVFGVHFTADVHNSMDMTARLGRKDRAQARYFGYFPDKYRCMPPEIVPLHVQTYVHRVGRTARAGREGLAYTLLQGYEVKPFKALLR